MFSLIGRNSFPTWSYVHQLREYIIQVYLSCSLLVLIHALFSLLIALLLQVALFFLLKTLLLLLFLFNLNFTLQFFIIIIDPYSLAVQRYVIWQAYPACSHLDSFRQDTVEFITTVLNTMMVCLKPFFFFALFFKPFSLLALLFLLSLDLFELLFLQLSDFELNQSLLSAHFFWAHLLCKLKVSV